MSLLSIFLTESPTTSGVFFINAVRTALKRQVQEFHDMSCTFGRFSNHACAYRDDRHGEVVTISVYDKDIHRSTL